MFLYLHYFHIFWSSSPIPQFYNFHIPKLPYIFIPLSPSSPIQEFNNSLTPIFLNSTNPLMPLSLHSLFPFPLLHIHIFPYSQFPIIPYSLYFPFFFKFADFLVKVTVILEPYDMHFRVRFKIWPFSGQNWVKIPLAPRGVLAPVSAHAAGPSAQPPSALAEFFRHTCLQSCLQTSPPTPQKSYLKFQNSTTSLSWIYLILANFPVKIGLIGGEGGSSLPCLRTRRDPPLSPPRH